MLIGLHFVLSVGAQQNNFTQIKESRIGCIPARIVFTSQGQVDSFPLNYPGCNTILGSVSIESDVYNVDSLIQLNRIEGDLSVYTNDITSLSGLGSIEYLMMFYLENGSGLINLNGLNNVDTIRYIWIQDADIIDFSGLDDLIYTESLRIRDCQLLRSLTGLENLSIVEDYLIIAGNPSLQDLSALNNLQQINDLIIISGNDSLNSIAGLNNADISSVETLYITDNNMLSTCNEPFLCEYLSNPSGAVNINGNAPGCNNPSEIADSCGFDLPCLPYGNYYVLSQSEADSFAVNYPECSELNGELTIQGADITDLSGLIGVEKINGNLWVTNNDILTDFTGLDSLHSIEGNFYVGYYEANMNNSLVNFSGLGNLERVGEEFIVMNNFELQNFNGLQNLKYAGDLNIATNWKLSSLDGLNNLDTVAGVFALNSELLTTLTGLENLKYADEFAVWENTLMTSLHGIDSIKLGSIYIGSNPLLSECEVKSVCNLLSIPGSNAQIEYNATGCNSREEVEENCLVGTLDLDSDTTLFIYPNPAGDFFTIGYKEKAKPEQLDIYNSFGQIVFSKYNLSENEWIDISILPAGIYFARIDLMNFKFIKK